jgi:hypothetical protein
MYFIPVAGAFDGLQPDCRVTVVIDRREVRQFRGCAIDKDQLKTLG